MLSFSVGTFKVLAENKYEARAKLNQEIQKYEATAKGYDSLDSMHQARTVVEGWFTIFEWSWYNLFMLSSMDLIMVSLR